MTTSLVRPSGNAATRIPHASAVPIVGDFFHELRRYG
jgi:hypothetical protein